LISKQRKNMSSKNQPECAFYKKNRPECAFSLFFKLYAFILLTSTLVPGIWYGNFFSKYTNVYSVHIILLIHVLSKKFKILLLVLFFSHPFKTETNPPPP